MACYYFPNWGPVATSEWRSVKLAEPRFAGHQQPKIPMWGYEDENDPGIMAKKIDAAAEHGIDVFIFDWYCHDSLGVEDEGGKYLYKALEGGFLKAVNNSKLKFAILWCNHDVGSRKGAVKPKTFDEICDYVIQKYFRHPSYWKIDGCPYFSVYQFDTFLQTFNNDTTLAVSALQKFRTKVKEAGFPDLHLDASLWSLKGESRNKLVSALNINSLSTYVWIHHAALPQFPASEYATVADNYFSFVENGGGTNGLETPARTMQVPYYFNVTMGWDASSRCKGTNDYWMSHRTPYPFGPVMVNNTPDLFKKYLGRAKSLTLLKPVNDRIVMINSWNEWGEGSYLEPDINNGMKYLQAVKSVFGNEEDMKLTDLKGVK